MGGEGRLPLFETKEAKGRIAYRLFSISIFVGICLIWVYRVTHVPGGGIGRWAWLGMLGAELWFGFYWILTQTVRWRPIYRYTFKERLSQRCKDDLPGVDIFVCTADPTIEPPMLVVNTVLSLIAYDYPSDKLAIYLSDDGGSDLTFYALLEASHFAKDWIPFCKKFEVDPRSPSAYFAQASEPLDFHYKEEWSTMKKLYQEMEDRIQSVLKLGRVNEEIQAEHKGFSEWNSVQNSRNHQTILQILIDGRHPNAVDNAGFVMPTLVYLSREKRPQHQHNFKAGALNALITSPWFIPFCYVIIAKYTYSLAEHLRHGETLEAWWNDQRIWLYRKTSAFLFGTISCALNLLGIAKSTFTITVKIADDELSKRYEQEIMEFGTTSPMFTILATLAMINLLCLGGAIKRVVMDDGVGAESLVLQFAQCGLLVLINLPIYEGLFFRKDEGRMPPSLAFTSTALAVLASVMPMH